jgi:multidrug efflux pump subunit AcrA (membrane-fusion protein)
MRRRHAWLVVVLLVAAMAVVGGFLLVHRLRATPAASGLPVAAARRGEFVVIVRSRGVVKAGRSAAIYAPIVPNLSIAWIAPEGEEVREGEPIIRFDSSSAEQQLVQREAALKQAQAALDQAIAQSRMTAERDRSDVQDARYAVETAGLRILENDLVARIQAEQARVDLSIAEQKLRMQEANVALHEASDASKIASLTRQRDLARAEVELTRRRLSQMELRAPLTGFVVVNANYSQGPVSANPFKVGDSVFSGMNLAEMPDMTSLLMDGEIEEVDRGRIATGREVRVRIDALPEVTLKATLTAISPLTEVGDEWPPVRSFRAYAGLGNADSRLRPGMNGSMDIVVERLPGAISIPARAVFTRDGHPVVYVARGGRHVPVRVQVRARNPDEVAVSGIDAGTQVALAVPQDDES